MTIPFCTDAANIPGICTFSGNLVFANYYYDLAEDLEGFKNTGTRTSPWIFGGEEALEGLLLLEAMANSSTSKKWANVDLTSP